MPKGEGTQTIIMRIYQAFIVAELKMFFRDRAALFWTLAFPIVMMVVFGLFNFGSFEPPEVGIVDNARNDASKVLVSVLKGEFDGEPLFNVPDSQDAEELQAQILDGDITAVMVIPQGFGEPGSTSVIDLTFDGRAAQEAESARAILAQVLDGVFQNFVDVPPEYRVENWVTVSLTEVEGKGQGYKGFVVPGIVSLSIMQSALFGVVFHPRTPPQSRRPQAPPRHPDQSPTLPRGAPSSPALVLLIMQTYVLLMVGIFVSGVEVAPGNAAFWLEVIPLIILGGIVFASLGLAVSGIAKTENTAAPLANIISLPMMFLSGVFIPHSVIPDWVVAFARWLPLTFLADGMRAMVNSGETFFIQGASILGLAAWGVICFVLAVKAFRWE